MANTCGLICRSICFFAYEIAVARQISGFRKCFQFACRILTDFGLNLAVGLRHMRIKRDGLY